MVSLDRFQVTQHHNKPALQRKEQSVCQAYPHSPPLHPFLNLTSSPSHFPTPHPFPSSFLHISTPSHLHTCISSKGTCFASPLHTLRGFSSPMSTAQNQMRNISVCSMLCTLALMPSVHASSQVLHSTLGEEELATLGSVCGIHVSLTVHPLSPSQVRFPLRQSAYSVVMRIYLSHSFHKAFYSTCLLHLVFIDFSC